MAAFLGKTAPPQYTGMIFEVWGFLPGSRRQAGKAFLWEMR